MELSDPLCCLTAMSYPEFRVRKLERIENPQAMHRLLRHEKNIADSMPIDKLDENRQTIIRDDDDGTAWLERLEKKNELSHAANTRYLFHGTKREKLEGISTHGLSAKFSMQNSFDLYGKGIYFTDSACKAAQYIDSPTNFDGEDRLILVCRVVLGRVFVAEHECEHATAAPPGYDSLQAKHGHTRRSSGVQVHNEYVVYNDCQCYPEFALRWKRS